MPLKAILIDADPQAIYQLEKQITSLSVIEVIGTYNDPFLGKEAVLAENIDVVFLETMLPRLSGIVLAKQLKQINTSLDIVFVTDHKEYAIDAYNLNALDYVLKPIQTTRFIKTIERLQLRFSKTSS